MESSSCYFFFFFSTGKFDHLLILYDRLYIRLLLSVVIQPHSPSTLNAFLLISTSFLAFRALACSRRSVSVQQRDIPSRRCTQSPSFFARFISRRCLVTERLEQAIGVLVDLSMLLPYFL